MIKRLMILLPLVALTFGCATSQLEQSFGDAARQTMSAQIYDQAAASNPNTEPVELDGQYGQSVMQVYRNTVGEPNSVLPGPDRLVVADPTDE